MTTTKQRHRRPKATVAPTTLQIRLRVLFSVASKSGKSRWGGNHPIPNARIAVLGSPIQVVTNASGNAILPRAGLPSSPVTLRVSPDPTQLSPGPAGPSVATGAQAATMIFRPFDVVVSLDRTGFLNTPAPTVSTLNTPGNPPPHALVFECLPTALTLDWKPDWVQSAHHGSSRTRPVSCLVLHQTAFPEVIGSVLNEFTAPNTTSSAHYVVDIDGHAVKLVQDALPSFHAGWSFWQGSLGLNDFSIGIEVVHSDTDGPTLKQQHAAPHSFTNEQYQTLLRLIPEIRSAFPAITRQQVVGHSDIEIQGRRNGEKVTHFQLGTSRQEDPGRMFEWERLEAADLARAQLCGPPPAVVYGIRSGQTLKRGTSPPSSNIFQLKIDLAAIGYSVSDGDGLPDNDVFSVALERAIARFQRRYLSGARTYPGMPLGALDYTTAWTLSMVVPDTSS